MLNAWLLSPIAHRFSLEIDRVTQNCQLVYIDFRSLWIVALAYVPHVISSAIRMYSSYCLLAECWCTLEHATLVRWLSCEKEMMLQRKKASESSTSHYIPQTPHRDTLFPRRISRLCALYTVCNYYADQTEPFRGDKLAVRREKMSRRRKGQSGGGRTNCLMLVIETDTVVSRIESCAAHIRRCIACGIRALHKWGEIK